MTYNSIINTFNDFPLPPGNPGSATGTCVYIYIYIYIYIIKRKNTSFGLILLPTGFVYTHIY